MSAALKAAQASGDHWGLAAKACLHGLEPLPAGANLGFVYVTEGFGDDLSSIVTFLRETTAIDDWLGAVGYGVFGPAGEVHTGRALALMVGTVAEEGAVRLFDRFDPADLDQFMHLHGDWLADQTAVSALVHGDPREPQIAAFVAGLAEAGHAFLIGGLTAAREAPSQVSRRVSGGGLSGALFGDGVSLITGMSQGCSPIGTSHRVSEAVDNVIMALDGEPALNALKAEVGDIIGRDLQRAAGYIHVARLVEGSDRQDYVVRGLMAIDPERGWLAVGDRLSTGDRLIFVRRDPNTAQQDMKRMLKRLTDRLTGRPVRGGVYVSCVARGARMFGRDGRETEMIHEALGDFPLVGFSASGEICHNRLYGFTSILTLFL